MCFLFATAIHGYAAQIENPGLHQAEYMISKARRVCVVFLNV